MSFKYARGALRPSQNYVCFSCRLQNFRITNSQRPRNQHAEASQTVSNAEEDAIPSQNAKPEDRTGLKPKGEPSSRQAQPSDVGSKNNDNNNGLEVNGMQKDPIKRSIPNAQASKLEQDLQRQFAELRRQNLAKIGLRPAPETSGEGPNSGTTSTQIANKRATVKLKDTELGRKARLKRQKLASAKKQPSSKSATKSSQRLPNDKEDNGTAVNDEETEGKTSAAKAGKNTKTDAHKQIADADLLKLYTDVHTLNKAVKVDDEAKGVRTKSTDQNPPLPTKGAARSRSKETRKVGPASQAPSSSKKAAVELTDTAKIRKHVGTLKIRKHASDSTDKDAIVKANEMKPHASSSTGLPSTESSMTRRAPSLTAPPGTRSRKSADIKAVSAADLEIKALDNEQPPVRNMSYGLERVLFNPGVYHLQDPRSRVYNFDPYLQKIMPVAEFDFNALKAYVTSSGDRTLNNIAQTHGKRYTGSSSSMTGVLTHFHFLLSQWRDIKCNMLSHEFPVNSSLKTFTLIQRAPSAVFLRWKEGTYAMDADKQFASANILMMLGKSMEKLLTLSRDEFERYRKSNPDEVPAEERNAPESYHYSTMGDFLMRSQLDAHDPRLPGTGMFDLKTRAVVSVRMDAKHHEVGMDYEIKTRLGPWESYEREYFDMIRAAFLKYSLQVRMGRMDGIFVAFHNTQRIFGFQYISSAEMDASLHGQWDTSLGDQEFKLSLDLLNQVLDRATKKYPETSLRLHFETRDAQTNFMYIFAEPVTEEQVDELQSANDREVEEFERNILGLSKEDAEAEDSEADDGQWADMQANVEEEMDSDEASLTRAPKGESLSEDAEPENATDEDSVASSAEDLDAEEEVEENEDDEELSDAKEEDAAALSEQELDPEGVVEERLQDHPDTGNVAAEDDPAEPVEDASSGTETSDDTQPATTKVGDANEVDDNDDPEAAVPERPTHKIIESATGELRVESPDPDNPDFDTTQADAPFLDTITSPPPTPSQEVLAMTLTIRNKVNDRYVVRPENLTSGDAWTVEYALAEVENPAKAWSLYQASQARRKKQLDKKDDDDDKTVEWYIRNLRELSKKGKEWRRMQDEIDRGRGKVVLGQEGGEGEKSGEGEDA